MFGMSLDNNVDDRVIINEQDLVGVAAGEEGLLQCFADSEFSDSWITI